jgi:hypothetical protein
MANRFPLIIDTDDGNKIKELPIGDNLNFDGAGIVNLSSVSITGSISGGSLSSNTTLSVTGNGSIGGTLAVTGTSALTGNVTAAGDVAVTGNISAATITLGGSNLQLPVQSDWTEANSASLAFIRNKPTSFAPDNLDDIGDVFVSSATANQVLTYDGFSWTAQDPAGGIGLADLSVVQNPASGSGSLLYNNGTGVFTFTPPVVPVNVSDLINDSGYTTLAIVESQNYLQTGDVLSTGRITRSVASNQVTVGFDETGLLQTVTVSGNLSGDGTGANPIVLNDSISLGVVNATSTSTASTFKDITVDNIALATALTSTSGDITLTNGDITVTNGTITSNFVDANEFRGATISNSGGNITLAANNIVLNTAPSIRMGVNNTLPVSGASGDLWHTGTTLSTWVNDRGDGNPGWISLGGNFAPTGLSVPIFNNSNRPSATIAGQLILNLDTNTVQISTGTNWIDVGP